MSNVFEKVCTDFFILQLNRGNIFGSLLSPLKGLLGSFRFISTGKCWGPVRFCSFTPIIFNQYIFFSDRLFSPCKVLNDQTSHFSVAHDINTRWGDLSFNNKY